MSLLHVLLNTPRIEPQDRQHAQFLYQSFIYLGKNLTEI